MKAQANMWTRWRSTYYDAPAALEAMYPHMLSNPRIQQALAAIKNAEAAIDAVMREQAKIEDMEELAE